MVQLFCDISNAMDDAKDWVVEHKKGILIGIGVLVGAKALHGLLGEAYWAGERYGMNATVNLYSEATAKAAPESAAAITNELNKMIWDYKSEHKK